MSANHDEIRQRISRRFNRRLWLILHAITFISVMLLSVVIVRAPLMARALPFIFVIWAVVVTFHATWYYVTEAREDAIQREIERVEAMTKRKRDNPDTATPYTIGDDGELIPDDADDPFYDDDNDPAQQSRH